MSSDKRDDRSEHCIPFILDLLNTHQQHYHSKSEQAPPFFIGLNGVQGAGKTTLVTALQTTLSQPPHNLPTLVLSIDDLYLPHRDQLTLASSHPDNPLIQHRGEPSTHDVPLGKRLFSALAKRESDVKIPAYDKSAFNGAGDRVLEGEWKVVNRAGEPRVEVVLFEGWCVGFRALTDGEVEGKWRAAREEFEKDGGEGHKGQLGRQKLESALFVNASLRDYDALTDRFDAFVHIDAEDPLYVYDWRLEPERAMREAKGQGMTDEQVIKFVDGYYPAYELYTSVLREGIFRGEGAKGRQLRMVVGKDRRVKEVFHL